MMDEEAISRAMASLTEILGDEFPVMVVVGNMPIADTGVSGVLIASNVDDVRARVGLLAEAICSLTKPMQRYIVGGS